MEEYIKKWRKDYFRQTLLYVGVLFAIICLTRSMIDGLGICYLRYMMAAGALLIAFCVFSFRWYLKTLQKSPTDVVRYFIIHTALQFLLGGALLVVARLVMDEGTRRPSMLSFGIYFILLLMTESFLFIRIEKNLNEAKN